MSCRKKIDDLCSCGNKITIYFHPIEEYYSLECNKCKKFGPALNRVTTQNIKQFQKQK